MSEKLLLRVAESLPLPGLGVLLRSQDAPPELAHVELHTALRLTLRYSSGEVQHTTATVEEIARPGEPERRVLLLTQHGATPVPAGTEVWWTGEAASWEDLL